MKPTENQLMFVPDLIKDVYRLMLEGELDCEIETMYKDGRLHLHIKSEHEFIINVFEGLRYTYLDNGIYFDHEWDVHGKELWWYLDGSIMKISKSTEKQTPPY